MNSPKHSTHHILAKNEGGTNHRHNLVELKHSVHQAIHTVFGNEPINEKIRTIVDVEMSALRADVVNELLAVLEARGDELENWYKPEVLKPKKKHGNN